jgi:hypothetical protein
MFDGDGFYFIYQIVKEAYLMVFYFKITTLKLNILQPLQNFQLVIADIKNNL